MSEEEREFYRIWARILRDTRTLYHFRKASVEELRDVAGMVFKLMGE